MRALVIEDGRLLVAQREPPQPGNGEVLIDVRAAGINNADLAQARGRYPAPAGVVADIPGLEAAGVVSSLGPGVTRWTVGDRVMALLAGGGHAESVVADEGVVLRVPDAISWPEAGGFPEVFATAHDALFTQGQLTAGDRLLVQGAAGGVGVAAVQLGREAGAGVVATVRAEERRGAVSELGAEVHAPGDLADQEPFDVILELVGGEELPADIERLAIGGRLVVIGVGAGGTAQVDFTALMRRRASIHASTMRSRSLREKEDVVAGLERDVLPLLADGRVRVPVEATFALASGAEAYERFQAGRKLGKIVLTVEANG